MNQNLSIPFPKSSLISLWNNQVAFSVMLHLFNKTQRPVHKLYMITFGGTLEVLFAKLLKRSVIVHAMDQHIRQHGEQVTHDGEHRRKGILRRWEQKLESDVRVSKEVHQRRRQKHSTRELCAEKQERAALSAKVGQYAPKKCHTEDNNQSRTLGHNQALRSQVHSTIGRHLVVGMTFS